MQAIAIKLLSPSYSMMWAALLGGGGEGNDVMETKG